MSLVLRRREGESWKDAAMRLARPWGLEGEVEAAWMACYEWDVLSFEAEY